ncbi:unnamed protein product [Caenorhabditis auriculariae]|uniref:UNC93-like protein MFSD11 n=1 Tax=Caenorhabditis auriculariae TaxID=2777116 RepID=A0A8S1GWJ1_9PELO|nr:unnamed protein product [Caenorhabditis auriculariae]
MKWRLDNATLNILQLGLGFFFNFFAFNSQGFIEEPVIDSASDRGNINKHAGYYSLSIIYATFTLGNFIAAPIVDILSPKWGMVVGALCYTAFQVGFLFLNQIYLYISSAVSGIIWTGQGSYLSQNCTEKTTSKNSALLWALAQTSLLGGGIFLFLVFHQSNTTDNISTSTVNTLYSIFSVMSLVSVVVLALLRTPVYKEVKTEKTDYKLLLASTFKLMFTKRMFLLAFKLGNNTNSLLALNSITTGVGQIVAGLLFGLLGDKTKKIGKDSIVFLGTIVHLITFALVYINFPSNAPLRKTDDIGGLITPNVVIALLCGGLLGFGDACWNTQIYSLLCDCYPNLSSQAFALFKFYQSGLACAAFFYSPNLQLQWHLVILVLTSLIAAACFFSSFKDITISAKDIKEEFESRDKEIAETRKTEVTAEQLY